MRPLFDDFDEFDFDDSPSVARLLREKRREKSKQAIRKFRGPKNRRYYDDRDEEYEDTETSGQFSWSDDYVDYDDYNEEEFDLYAGIGREH